METKSESTPKQPCDGNLQPIKDNQEKSGMERIGSKVLEYISRKATNPVITKIRHVLACIQLAGGVLCMLTNIVTVALPRTPYLQETGIGIWGGILFVACGSVGIAAIEKTRLVVSHLVLSIISIVIAIIGFGLACAGMSRPNYYIDSDEYRLSRLDDDFSSDDHYHYRRNDDRISPDVYIAMMSLSVIAFLVEIVVSTCIASAYCSTKVRSQTDTDSCNKTDTDRSDYQCHSTLGCSRASPCYCTCYCDNSPSEPAETFKYHAVPKCDAIPTYEAAVASPP